MKTLLISLSLALLFVRGACGQSAPYAPSPSVAPNAVDEESALTVYVDVMPACPRRGCWAATSEALQRLDRVKWVEDGAGRANLRRVHMSELSLPDPRAWEATFREYVVAKGLEPLKLTLSQRTLDWENGSSDAATTRAKVTGALRKDDDGFVLEVRELTIIAP